LIPRKAFRLTPSKFHSLLCFSAPAICLLFGACVQLPTTGPSAVEIGQATTGPDTAAIQVVDVDDSVARRLGRLRNTSLFSDVLGAGKAAAINIGLGDDLEVNIWEAPPATLFGGGGIDIRTGLSTARPTTLPVQTVDAQGMISVPFAGRVQAAGRSQQAIETEIANRLRGKANQPEVMVRVVRNASAVTTVVGEVNLSIRMPLTAAGERILDALAAAGGVRQPISKTTLQLTRNNQFHSLPLDLIVRDPRQNVPLQPGDVISAIFEPMSFTALGATGKNDEVAFEAQGITLAQALARAGGLFIFRFEPEAALEWPHQPVRATPEGMVPVVYRLDLRSPKSFFVMQNFAINNKDIV
jgi:polysaccharide export outer membrane protein